MEGFPIRKSADITAICASPRLIAACHVLHRLPMPRHSPCALITLNSFFYSSYLKDMCMSYRKSVIFASCNFITLYFSWKDLNLYNNLISFCLWFAFSYSLFNVRFLGILMNTYQKILSSKYPFVDIHQPIFLAWWAQVDSNHRPHAYQACALTTWAMSPYRCSRLSPLGGDERDRTDDPLLAKQVLSQLSYTPIFPECSCEPQKLNNEIKVLIIWPWMLNESLSIR